MASSILICSLSANWISKSLSWTACVLRFPFFPVWCLLFSSLFSISLFSPPNTSFRCLSFSFEKSLEANPSLSEEAANWPAMTPSWVPRLDRSLFLLISDISSNFFPCIPDNSCLISSKVFCPFPVFEDRGRDSRDCLFGWIKWVLIYLAKWYFWSPRLCDMSMLSSLTIDISDAVQASKLLS